MCLVVVPNLFNVYLRARINFNRAENNNERKILKKNPVNFSRIKVLSEKKNAEHERSHLIRIIIKKKKV